MNRKLSANIVMALLAQFVITICAFVISHKILATYGSEANGLLQSVTRFMSFITLLEGGFGGVIKAAFYKPLHQADRLQLCRLFNSTRRIFARLGFIILVYAIIIGLFFNQLSDSSYDRWTCFALVLVISGATIAEYVVGISYDLILQADQKVYISSGINIVFHVLRVGIMYLVILLRGSLFAMEAAFLVLFMVKVSVLRYIARSQYDFTLTKERQIIESRWDGMIQHIAYSIHNNVDIILITLFLTLRDVSVYSVYSMIVAAVNKVTKAIATGTSASFGKIIASGDNERLCKASEKYVFSSSVVSAAVFATVSGIVMPFVGLYTRGVSDAEYRQPVYAYLIILAEAVYCLRIPVKTIVGAAGHYRQTRNGAMVEAGINLVLSLALIPWIGIPGILAATLVAMIYRTIDLTRYLIKHLLLRRTKVVPMLLTNFCIVLVASFEMLLTIKTQCHSYLTLIGVGIAFGAANLVLVAGINTLVFGDVMNLRKKLARITGGSHK